MWLNEYLVETYAAARRAPEVPTDAAFDTLIRFCVAAAQRDPELGRWTVRKLSERALLHNLEDGEVTADTADQHDRLARAIHGALLEAGHVQEGWLDEWWAQDDYVPPPPRMDLS